MWQICKWPPLCFGSIILASNSYRFINNSQICDSNSPPSWVSVKLRVCPNLMNIRHSQSCFFLQFSDGTLFRCLIHIHETSGKCPCSLKRLVTSLNQQHLWLCLPRYNDAVSRNSWSWIFVCITHIIPSFILIQSAIFLCYFLKCFEFLQPIFRQFAFCDTLFCGFVPIEHIMFF